MTKDIHDTLAAGGFADTNNILNSAHGTTFGPFAEAATPSATPDLDTAKYLPALSGYDLTEAQKLELLQTLWSIMRGFVELGFSANICESFFGEHEALSDPAVVDGSVVPSEAETPADSEGGTP